MFRGRLHSSSSSLLKSALLQWLHNFTSAQAPLGLPFHPPDHLCLIVGPAQAPSCIPSRKKETIKKKWCLYQENQKLPRSLPLTLSYIPSTRTVPNGHPPMQKKRWNEQFCFGTSLPHRLLVRMKGKRDIEWKLARSATPTYSVYYVSFFLKSPKNFWSRNITLHLHVKHSVPYIQRVIRDNTFLLIPSFFLGLVATLTQIKYNNLG